MTQTHNEKAQPHSAEYFGEYRDYWWNADYLDLIVRRHGLSKARSVLEVGCGVGHWGRLLCRVLPESAQITGVDMEAQWVSQAAEQARKVGLEKRMTFVQARAEQLPFAEASFDLVTCQTLLLHVPEPKAVMREMFRVLKPGGKILLVEPNNIAGQGVFCSTTFDEPVEATIARFRFELVCERGKQKLGLGFNSVGDMIPGWAAELGFANVSVTMNDKCIPLIPPYAPTEQKAFLEQMLDWYEKDFMTGGYEKARRYYLAGGGTEAEFEAYLASYRAEGAAFKKAAQAKTLHSGYGHIVYITTASKP